MKRAIIASIMGIAATVASYGQGYISFINYELAGPSGTTPVYSGVTYNGQYVGSDFNADLLYSLDGGVTFQAATLNSIGGIIPYVGFYTGSHTGGTPTSDGAGTINGGVTAIINGYTSGAVEFMMEAFNATSYASALIRGRSAVFTMSSLPTDSKVIPPDTLNLAADGLTIQGLQPFVVTAVPEPSLFALAGLGSAAVLIFRRRK